jgi:hypothetical protein
MYNKGYKAGHHATVEGQYVDILDEDMDAYRLSSPAGRSLASPRETTG